MKVTLNIITKINIATNILVNHYNIDNDCITDVYIYREHFGRIKTYYIDAVKLNVISKETFRKIELIAFEASSEESSKNFCKEMDNLYAKLFDVKKFRSIAGHVVLLYAIYFNRECDIVNREYFRALNDLLKKIAKDKDFEVE